MKRFSILSLFALVFFSLALYASMPVSSFIIEPEKLHDEIYSQKESRFRIKSSDKDFDLPRTSTQKIVSDSRAIRGRQLIVATGDFSLQEDCSVSKYLKDTPYLNLNSREIRESAAKFSKSKDPVKDISLFVYNHISDKKEGIPIIPALSILKNRAGDCTEHSVLTVSLLRASGIPARAVVGIILSEYFNGKRDVFVYHMWVEAYVNKKWILVDSTRPMHLNHNRYIAFTFHNLKTEGPIDYLNALSVITNIKIRQVD
ncbi:MAG TPA: transglutaminase-like domain-containing protein [Spirochaetota bacterium]|nr:transglutaminase-like domain-containing protein [Spirochaetota bacterium]HPJ40905.1 transglutaminase-like domain-containing protein [Spirochaetota bacterium]HRX47759.1 transglutaminase-like domain-containing protein [Spirochaetota bacterium]